MKNLLETPKTTGERFERAVEIMRRLRAPDGCPWDRKQTHQTITQYTLEEAYEVVEAIEKEDWRELTGELGDLTLQVLFYAQMGKEEGRFDIDQVLDVLCEKLIRRHPHVFAEVTADTPEEVLRNWEQIKKQERAEKAAEEGSEAPKKLLDSVSTAMPALLEGLKLSKKAAAVGFDWPDAEGLFDKLKEETAELRAEVEQLPVSDGKTKPNVDAASEDLRRRISGELGDLFFVAVNLARYFKVDPEAALRQTNRKFRRRFNHVEQRVVEQGKRLEECGIDELEGYWQEAKGSE